jgi:hypothetical protein
MMKRRGEMYSVMRHRLPGLQASSCPLVRVVAKLIRKT